MSSQLLQAIDPIIASLEPLSQWMAVKFKLPSYHRIELYIYFNNFIDDELKITKDSFIIANSNLIDWEDSNQQEWENWSTKIYDLLCKTATMPWYWLYAYITTITNTEEIDVDVWFAIWDKNKKRYIDYGDIDILINTFEDFIDERFDWSNYEKSFDGKKITKRNLSQNGFDTKIGHLFEQAEEIILKTITKSYEHTIAMEKSVVDNALQTNHSSNAYNNIKDNMNPNQIGLLGGYQQNQFFHNPHTVHDTNVSSGNIWDMIFDQCKIETIEKIKMSSLLYDVYWEEFLEEFNKYKNDSFDKETFISFIDSIIQSKTSNLLKSPIKKLAWSMLFQIIDVGLKNKITKFEALGGIIPWTKDNSIEEKTAVVFNYKKTERWQILRGILSWYVNTNIIHDWNIISEWFIKLVADEKLYTASDIIKWVNSTAASSSEGDKKAILDWVDYSMLNEEGDDDKEDEEFLQELKRDFHLKYDEMKAHLVHELRHLSINNVTQHLLNNSLWGQINNLQLSQWLDILIKEKYDFKGENDKDYDKMKFNCLKTINNYFNFAQNELIDITIWHALFLLIFEGTTVEKMQSIFTIHDANDFIEVNEWKEYFTHVFYFIWKEMKIVDELNLMNVARDLIEEWAFFKEHDNITITTLVQFYESVWNKDS